MKKFLLFLFTVLCTCIVHAETKSTNWDFSKANTSYGSQNSDGWSFTNTCVVGYNNSFLPTLNGKTTANGTATSSSITGGIASLTIDYVNTYSDTKAGFDIEIIQNNSTVKKDSFSDSSASQNSEKSYTWNNINIEGNFTIKLTNNSPSNSTSNKDRTSIIKISWDTYSAETPVDPVPVDFAFDTNVPTEMTVGETYTLNLGSTLPKDFEIISGDDDVATVSETAPYIITAVSAGSADFTAMWEADENFNKGEFDFTITVKDNAVDPTPGGDTGEVTFDFTKSAYGFPNNKNTYVTTPATISEGAVNMTLNGNTNAWRYWSDDPGLRVYYKNEPKFTITVTDGKVTDVSWTNKSGVAFKEDGGSSTITSWSGNAESITFDGSVGTSNVALQTVTVKYVLNAGAKTPAGLKFSETTVSATLNGDFTKPTLSKDTDGKITYTSSDTDVATVNAETGDVEIVKYGTTTITATSEETETYAAGSASYTLNVTPGRVSVATALALIDEKYTGTVQVEGYISKIDEVDTGSYGNAIYYLVDEAGTSAPAIQVYHGYWLNGDKFTKGDEIEVGGKVVVEGTLTTYNGTKEVAQYSKIIEYTAPAKKTPADIAWPAESYNGNVRLAFESPVLLNNSDVDVTYASSNEAVATVDASNGTVNILASGSTTISATSTETPDFAETTVSYTLNVVDPYDETVVDRLNVTNFSANGSGYSNYTYTSEETGIKYVACISVNNGMQINSNAAGGNKARTGIAVSENSNNWVAKTLTITWGGTLKDLSLVVQEDGSNFTLSEGDIEGKNFGLYDAWENNLPKNPTATIVSPSTTETPVVYGFESDCTYFGIFSNAATALSSIDIEWSKPGELNKVAVYHHDDDQIIVGVAHDDYELHVRKTSRNGASNIRSRANLVEWSKAESNPLVIDKTDPANQNCDYMVTAFHKDDANQASPSNYVNFYIDGEGILTGVDAVDADTSDAPVEFFDLQGRRVMNPVNGLYIRRQGNSVEKVLVK